MAATYTSQIPILDDEHVLASSFQVGYEPKIACDPSKSLIGGVGGVVGGVTLPSGLIIPFNDIAANIPSGWDRFTGIYYIILSSTGNAGDSYDQDNKLQTSITLATNAWNHNHLANTIDDGGGNTTDGVYHGSEDASHNHTFAQAWTSHTPLYYALTFIQAI